MKRLIYIYWLIGGFIGSISLACVDQIELDVDPEENPEVIVVDGLITPGEGPYEIRIFKTAARGSQLNEAVSVREAKVEDDLGNSELLFEKEPGVYELRGETIRGEIGRSYTLSFTLVDGSRYRSKPEKLLPVSEIDTMNYEVDFAEIIDETGQITAKTFVFFSADLNLTSLPESPLMRWEVSRWWGIVEVPKPIGLTKICYINDPPARDGIQLFDGRGSDQSQWKNQPVGALPIDFRFFQKNVITVYLYSLTSEAFRYWDRVDRVVDQTGTIFDSPPAAVQGNVFNEDRPFEPVMGYFGASAVDSFFFPIFRQDLSMFQNIQWFCDKPELALFYGRLSPCIDCLVIPNSQVERPYFFDL
ncbi:MAG: DUF4249 domain-containing protein [Bacteroidota bacterium]